MLIATVEDPGRPGEQRQATRPDASSFEWELSGQAHCDHAQLGEVNDAVQDIREASEALLFARGLVKNANERTTALQTLVDRHGSIDRAARNQNMPRDLFREECRAFGVRARRRSELLSKGHKVGKKAKGRFGEFRRFQMSEAVLDTTAAVTDTDSDADDIATERAINPDSTAVLDPPMPDQEANGTMMDTASISPYLTTTKPQPKPAWPSDRLLYAGDRKANRPLARASAKTRLPVVKTCQRGHTYSTEGAPVWLGGRCPTCRTVGKAEWERRRLRISAGGLRWSYGAPSLEVRRRVDELLMEFLEKQRREYEKFTEQLEAEVEMRLVGASA